MTSGNAVAAVLVQRNADGVRVTRFGTKKAARAEGMRLRRAGANVAMFSVAEFEKFIAGPGVQS